MEFIARTKATYSILLCGPEKGLFFYSLENSLSTLATNSSGKLNVLRHNSDTFSVDCAKICVFEQTHQVSFASFLECHHGGALKSQIGFEVLSDFSHQTLEREFADQELGGFLVTTNFTESYGAGPVTMGLLHTTCGRGALTSSLGCQLFPWGFATSTLTSGLLSTSHSEMNLLS